MCNCVSSTGNKFARRVCASQIKHVLFPGVIYEGNAGAVHLAVGSWGFDDGATGADGAKERGGDDWSIAAQRMPAVTHTSVINHTQAPPQAPWPSSRSSTATPQPHVARKQQESPLEDPLHLNLLSTGIWKPLTCTQNNTEAPTSKGSAFLSIFYSLF